MERPCCPPVTASNSSQKSPSGRRIWGRPSSASVTRSDGDGTSRTSPERSASERKVDELAGQALAARAQLDQAGRFAQPPRHGLELARVSQEPQTALTHQLCIDGRALAGE